MGLGASKRPSMRNSQPVAHQALDRLLTPSASHPERSDGSRPQMSSMKSGLSRKAGPRLRLEISALSRRRGDQTDVEGTS